MSAVEHIREEHKDVRNFEDLLQRHALREEEMNRRRGKVSTSHDQLNRVYREGRGTGISTPALISRCGRHPPRF